MNNIEQAAEALRKAQERYEGYSEDQKELGGLSDDLSWIAEPKVQLANLKKQISELEAVIDDLFWKETGQDKDIIVPGIGRFVKRFGKSYKKWDHEALYKEVGRLASESVLDPETGEVRTAEEAVGVTLDLMKDMQRPTWRTGALKAHDLDPDEYTETTWGKRTIQIMAEGSETIDNQESESE